MHALHNRAVVQRQHFNARAFAHAQSQRRNGFVLLRHKAGHAHRAAARDGEDGADGMRAIEGGIHAVAPVILFAVGDAGPDARAVVDVFALGVHHVAHVAPLIPAAHFERVIHITVVFGIGIHLSAALRRFDQLDGLRHRLRRKHLAQHVPPGVQKPYGERRVFVGIVGQHDRVHVVPEEILEIRIQRDAHADLLGGFSGLFERGLVFVAHGDELRVRMMNQHADHGHAAIRAKYADLQLRHKSTSDLWNDRL